MADSREIIDWLNANGDWLTIFAIILIFTIITVRYYYKKDKVEPEPKFRLLYAFTLGILSVIPAVALSYLMLVYIDRSLSTVIVAPIAEEIAKGLVVLYLARSDEMDGPLDGLIYGALVGTGFAFTENLLYAFTAFGESGFFSGVFVASFRSAFQIIGHPLYTGITGYGIGAAKVGLAKFKLGRMWQAIILHGIWNGSTLIQGYGLYPFLGVIIISIIILKYEVGKAIELDKTAEERGYYEGNASYS